MWRVLRGLWCNGGREQAHDSYGAWREGTHDDLVLAVALALWAGERQEVRGRPFSAAVGGERARLDGPLLTEREMHAPFDGRGLGPLSEPPIEDIMRRNRGH